MKGDKLFLDFIFLLRVLSVGAAAAAAAAAAILTLTINQRRRVYRAALSLLVPQKLRHPPSTRSFIKNKVIAKPASHPARQRDTDSH